MKDTVKSSRQHDSEKKYICKIFFFFAKVENSNWFLKMELHYEQNKQVKQGIIYIANGYKGLFTLRAVAVVKSIVLLWESYNSSARKH